MDTFGSTFKQFKQKQAMKTNNEMAKKERTTDILWTSNEQHSADHYSSCNQFLCHFLYSYHP